MYWVEIENVSVFTQEMMGQIVTHAINRGWYCSVRMKIERQIGC